VVQRTHKQRKNAPNSSQAKPAGTTRLLQRTLFAPSPLGDSEHVFREIIDSAADGILLADQRVSALTQVVRGMLGYSRGETDG